MAVWIGQQQMKIIPCRTGKLTCAWFPPFSPHDLQCKSRCYYSVPKSSSSRLSAEQDTLLVRHFRKIPAIKLDTQFRLWECLCSLLLTHHCLIKLFEAFTKKILLNSKWHCWQSTEFLLPNTQVQSSHLPRNQWVSLQQTPCCHRYTASRTWASSFKPAWLSVRYTTVCSAHITLVKKNWIGGRVDLPGQRWMGEETEAAWKTSNFLLHCSRGNVFSVNSSSMPSEISQKRKST